MNKSTRYYSKEQEKCVAKTINGKVQSNSGATAFQKGDVKSNYMLIECKTSTTLKTSFSVKKDVLQKLKQEKFEMGKDYCALAFNFGPNEPNYFVIDENLMKFLTARLEDDLND